MMYIALAQQDVLGRSHLVVRTIQIATSVGEQADDSREPILVFHL